MHPAVREAALVDDGCGGFVALVVPDDSYMDEVLGRGAAESTVLGKWRKTFDLSQLSRKPQPPRSDSIPSAGTAATREEHSPLTTCMSGSKTQLAKSSSFRQSQYVKSDVEPACSIRIAPHCDNYVAVDFSPVVLDRLREQFQSVPAVAARVELMQSRADNLDGLEQNRFDALVINSVIQYFPQRCLSDESAGRRAENR